MATLTVATIVRNPAPGVEQVLGAADAGLTEEFVNTGKEFIIIANGSGGAIVLTVITQVTVDGFAVDDYTASIPAGETRMIGPFPPGTYNDANSKVQMTLASDTSMTLGIFKTS